MGRLAVRPDRRGTEIMAALSWAALKHGVLHGGQVLIVDISFTLLRMYIGMGFRPYGAPLNTRYDRVGALMIALPDPAHSRSAGPLSREFISEISQQVILSERDSQPIQEAIRAAEGTLVTDPRRVFDELSAHRDQVPRHTFLRELPEGKLRALAAQGFTVDVEPGLALAGVGWVDPEVYLILEGSVEVSTPGRPPEFRGPGSLVGEEALESTDPRRVTAVVREAGRVLVMNRDLLRRLIQAG